MPTVFRHLGFRFFFHSNEGDPREPVHIHVMKDGGEAKFWLDPEPRLAQIIADRTRDNEEAWNEHFR